MVQLCFYLIFLRKNKHIVMNKSLKFVPAIIIAAGLATIGWGISSGLNSITEKSRNVSVRGLAEREMMADKVTWPIVFQQMGNDLPALYDAVSATDSQIVDYLKENGIPADDISITPPEVYDQQTNRYDSNRSLYRFYMTSVVVVTSAKVEQVNELIQRQGELLQKGIALQTNNYEYQISYEFTGLNAIKPQMIAEATKNAREAAQKFADDSDSKLGRIRNASQGQFSIENRDAYTPYIKNVRIVTYIDYELKD